VHRARPTQRGHLFFELVEKGRGDDIIGKLEAVLWRSDHLRVRRALRARDLALSEGHQIRCRGQLDFYGPAGRVQLVVREVDPLFSLGLLARRRQETLAALARAGLLERNRQRRLPPVVLDLVLVTSRGSAAFHDFVSGLAESGYGFRILLLPASVQGSAAEGELLAAFERIATLAEDAAAGWRPAAVVLVRGGGARTDLAAFDGRALAEAVARCPLPVLTGLGHETDQSVVDRVAHTALKTPTQVASFLVERAAQAEQAVLGLQETICRRAREQLAAASRAVERGERVAKAAQLRLGIAARNLDDAGRAIERLGRRRLGEAGRRLREVERRLAVAGPRLLERRRTLPEQLVQRLGDRARGRLERLAAVLDGHARLCAELAPQRLLARGFSITRDARGAVVRNPRQVRPGDVLDSEVMAGRIRSTVVTEEDR